MPLLRSVILIIALSIIILDGLINFVPLAYYYFILCPSYPLYKITKGAYFTYDIFWACVELSWRIGENITKTLAICTRGEGIIINITDVGNCYNITLRGRLITCLMTNCCRHNAVANSYEVSSQFTLSSSSPIIKMFFINSSSTEVTLGNYTLQLSCNLHKSCSIFPSIVTKQLSYRSNPIVKYLVLASCQKALYCLQISDKLNTFVDEYVNLILCLFSHVIPYKALSNATITYASVMLFLEHTNVKPYDILCVSSIAFIPLMISAVLIIIYIKTSPDVFPHFSRRF